MDVEVNASGFSKDIKAFDDALEEMEKNKDQEEDAEEDTEEGESNEEEDEEEKEVETEKSTKKESKKEEPTQGAVGGEPSRLEGITNPAENPEAEEELYDKFDENLHLSNKQFRAYRDKTESELVGSSEEDDNDDDDDDRNSCSTTTSTIMDARTVRNKCRKSVLKKIKAERRRIRNKGESALITDRNRENNDNIKASIHFFN